MEENYKELCRAILERAYLDYKNKDYRAGITSFIKSEWFTIISDIRPEVFIEALKHSVKPKQEKTRKDVAL